MTASVIKTLQAYGPLFLPDIINLKSVLVDLSELDDCTETKSTYYSAKYLLCWDITNSAMRITTMFLLLWVLLLAFLFFLFFSWYRFNLLRNPEDAFGTPGNNGTTTLKHRASKSNLIYDVSDEDSTKSAQYLTSTSADKYITTSLNVNFASDGINSDNLVALSGQEMGVFLDSDADEESNAEAPKNLLFFAEETVAHSDDASTEVSVESDRFIQAEVRLSTPDFGDYKLPVLKARAQQLHKETRRVVKKYFTTIVAILSFGLIMTLIVGVWLGLQDQYDIVQTRKC